MGDKVKDLISKFPYDKRWFLILAGVIVFISLTIYIMLPGINNTRTTYQKFISTQKDYNQKIAVENNIETQKVLLQQTKEEFETLAVNFKLNMSTGLVVQRIADTCTQNNITLNKIVPGDPVNQVYHGHLLANVIKVQVSGEYPNVLQAMRELENIRNPVEFREIDIKESKENNNISSGVTADMTAVFYSLSPPGKTEYVTAPSGVSNPFVALKQENPIQTISPEQIEENNLPLVNQVITGR